MGKLSEIYIGIDIGASNTRILIFDKAQKRFYPFIKEKFVYIDDPREEVERNIVCLIDKALNLYRIEEKEIKGIGVALAANFNRQTGQITRWPNHQSWNGFPLKKFLNERYNGNVAIVFEDDANAAAIGEYFACNSDIKYDNCIYLTVSTGIGCGIIINGKLFTGENGMAGEIGHVIIRKNGPPCKCGKRGCLQALVSGPALLERFKYQYPHESNVHSLSDVALLAENGIKYAKELFFFAGDILGDFCINLVQTLDISLIIMGGGVLQQAGEVIIDVVRHKLDRFLNDSHRKCLVKKSELNDINGALGALVLVYPHLNYNLADIQKMIIYSKGVVI